MSTDRPKLPDDLLGTEDGLSLTPEEARESTDSIGSMRRGHDVFNVLRPRRTAIPTNPDQAWCALLTQRDEWPIIQDPFCCTDKDNEAIVYFIMKKTATSQPDQVQKLMNKMLNQMRIQTGRNWLEEPALEPRPTIISDRDKLRLLCAAPQEGKITITKRAGEAYDLLRTWSALVGSLSSPGAIEHWAQLNSIGRTIFAAVIPETVQNPCERLLLEEALNIHRSFLTRYYQLCAKHFALPGTPELFQESTAESSPKAPYRPRIALSEDVLSFYVGHVASDVEMPDRIVQEVSTTHQFLTCMKDAVELINVGQIDIPAQRRWLNSFLDLPEGTVHRVHMELQGKLADALQTPGIDDSLLRETIEQTLQHVIGPLEGDLTPCNVDAALTATLIEVGLRFKQAIAHAIPSRKQAKEATGRTEQYWRGLGMNTSILKQSAFAARMNAWPNMPLGLKEVSVDLRQELEKAQVQFYLEALGDVFGALQQLNNGLRDILANQINVPLVIQGAMCDDVRAIGRWLRSKRINDGESLEMWKTLPFAIDEPARALPTHLLVLLFCQELDLEMLKENLVAKLMRPISDEEELVTSENLDSWLARLVATWTEELSREESTENKAIIEALLAKQPLVRQSALAILYRHEPSGALPQSERLIAGVAATPITRFSPGILRTSCLGLARIASQMKEAAEAAGLSDGDPEALAQTVRGDVKAVYDMFFADTDSALTADRIQTLLRCLSGCIDGLERRADENEPPLADGYRAAAARLEAILHDWMDAHPSVRAAGFARPEAKDESTEDSNDEEAAAAEVDTTAAATTAVPAPVRRVPREEPTFADDIDLAAGLNQLQAEKLDAPVMIASALRHFAPTDKQPNGELEGLVRSCLMTAPARTYSTLGHRFWLMLRSQRKRPGFAQSAQGLTAVTRASEFLEYVRSFPVALPELPAADETETGTDTGQLEETAPADSDPAADADETSDATPPPAGEKTDEAEDEHEKKPAPNVADSTSRGTTTIAPRQPVRTVGTRERLARQGLTPENLPLQNRLLLARLTRELRLAEEALTAETDSDAREAIVKQQLDTYMILKSLLTDLQKD